MDSIYKLNLSLRPTLSDRKAHICNTVERMLNYCKLLTSFTALLPLGAFQLNEQRKF